jgi:GTP cyclohydrolase II
MKKSMKHLEFVVSAKLPSEFGTFMLYGFQDKRNGQEHVAIVKGEIANQPSVLTRIHSECLTGDAFGSLKCDCRPQLIKSLEQIGAATCGIVLYLRQEGRGIGLLNKLRAYQLQDRGYDTLEANLKLGLPADARTYDIAADMLQYLEVDSVNIMTNNPDKIAQLRKEGIVVTERVEHSVAANQYNEAYLKTKNLKFGHLINLNASLAA